MKSITLKCGVDDRDSLGVDDSVSKPHGLVVSVFRDDGAHVGVVLTAAQGRRLYRALASKYAPKPQAKRKEARR